MEAGIYTPTRTRLSVASLWGPWPGWCCSCPVAASSHDNRDADNLETQLDFIMQELRNGYAGLGAKLDANPTINEAVGVMTKYLHPNAAPSRDDHLVRLQNAEALLREMRGV